MADVRLEKIVKIVAPEQFYDGHSMILDALITLKEGLSDIIILPKYDWSDVMVDREGFKIVSSAEFEARRADFGAYKDYSEYVASESQITNREVRVATEVVVVQGELAEKIGDLPIFQKNEQGKFQNSGKEICTFFSSEKNDDLVFDAIRQCLQAGGFTVKEGAFAFDHILADDEYDKLIDSGLSADQLLELEAHEDDALDRIGEAQGIDWTAIETGQDMDDDDDY